MQLTRRFRNILGVIAIQVLLFVLYSVRLHRTVRSEIAVATDGINGSRLSEYSRGSRTDDGSVSYTANVFELSVENNTKHRHNVSVTIVTGQLRSADNLETTVSIFVRDKGQDSHAEDDVTSLATNNSYYHSYSGANLKSADIRQTTNPIGYVAAAGRIVSYSNLYPANQILSFSKKDELGEECEQSFLIKYSAYCEKAIVPLLQQDNRKLCPCIPQTILGQTSISFTPVHLSQLEAEHPELSPGGHWTPSSCVPRQRIAIIVPFRDRLSHLQSFLQIMHKFLQNQMLYYTIFVVEQNSPQTFNKASLMNAGFEEIRRRHRFDCFIFHDVDMLPETDRNFYGCYKSPRHVGAYVDKFKYQLIYNGIYGGATAFTEKQFVKVNGYSNEFYGWGGEDDDMFNRIKWSHLKFIRFPKCVARYTMIKHSRDTSNPYDAKLANRAWAMRPSVYKINGLNSLVYKFMAYEERKMFTRILISLPEIQPRRTTAKNKA